ncbi:predicted protein [Sclerotinia sclerotiorum 1980 UF-70]|uniref:ATPase AAA-type core domain-containing protein n=1 Tax=Sclerotinia sclerotiorum (strain ATCC 18683 / 1980 / Ss-1) TaxID=665079 RepID=A7ES95_SCLS1|nr:predicted protein [Sclerotinia sclerotiorum 1980 UF-70]EDN92337.1 predicted protein [Sclerotinia sclerotiorum 1980 UF-70]
MRRAGFLKYPKHHQGIAFLTTNRVGIFDEAFASQIYISIWHSDLDDA